MENFTSFCANLKKTQIASPKQVAPDLSVNTTVAPNEYGGIYDRPKQPKKGFIQARLNRDNFWNLIFWFGISFGTIVTAFLSKAEWPKCAFIMVCCTLLGVPYVVRSYSNIIFTEDKKCLNSAGEILNKRCPNMFWFIVLNFAAIAFIGSLLDKYAQNVLQEALLVIFVPIIFFLPVFYFILKNCPVAILFYKNSWCEEITGIKNTNNSNKSLFSSFRHNSLSHPNSSDLYTNPIYKHLGGNIHHRH